MNERPERNCLWCGKSFTASRATQMCCSLDCQRGWRRHHVSKSEFLKANACEEVSPGLYRKACQWCGTEFETKNIQQRNCCPLCGKYLAKHGGVSKIEWQKSVRLRKEEARRKKYGYICAYCDKPFTPRKGFPDSKFCSEACRQHWHGHGGMSEADWLKKKGYYRKDGRIWADCLYCGTPTEVVEGREKFCSYECRVRYRNHITLGSTDPKLDASSGSPERRLAEQHGLTFIEHGVYEGKCLWCGEVFRTDNLNQRNCSSRCGRYLAKFGGHYSKDDWQLAQKGEYPCKVCGAHCGGTGLSVLCDPCLESAKSAVPDDVKVFFETFRTNLFERPVLRRSISPQDFTEEDSLFVVEHASELHLAALVALCEHISSAITRTRWHDGIWYTQLSPEEKEAYCAKRRARYAALPIERKLELNAIRRRRYWALPMEQRQELLARNRTKYASVRDRHLSQMKARRDAEVEARTAAYWERINKASAEEETRILAERTKFKSVEEVMLLPPEERWQYSKNWTAEERAYAMKLESGGVTGAFSGVSRLDDIGGMLDNISNEFLVGADIFSD